MNENSNSTNNAFGLLSIYEDYQDRQEKAQIENDSIEDQKIKIDLKKSKNIFEDMQSQNIIERQDSLQSQEVKEVSEDLMSLYPHLVRHFAVKRKKMDEETKEDLKKIKLTLEEMKKENQKALRFKEIIQLKSRRRRWNCLRSLDP